MLYNNQYLNDYFKNPEIAVPEYTKGEYLNYYNHIDNKTYFDLWNNSNCFFPYHIDIFDEVFDKTIEETYNFLKKIKDPALLVQLLFNDYKSEIQLLELSIANYSNITIELFTSKLQETTDLLPAIILDNIIKCELRNAIFENRECSFPIEFINILKKNEYGKNLVYNYMKNTINNLIFYEPNSLQYSNASKAILALKTILDGNKEIIINQIFKDLENNNNLLEVINFNNLKGIMLATLYVESNDSEQKYADYDNLFTSLKKLISNKNSFPNSYCFSKITINEAHKTIAEIIINSTNSIKNYYLLLSNINEIIHTMRFYKSDTEHIDAISFILVIGLSLIDITIKNDEKEESSNLLSKLLKISFSLKNIFGDSYFTLFLSCYQKHLITRYALLLSNFTKDNLLSKIICLLPQTDSKTALKSLEMIEYNKIKLDYTTLDNNDKKIILQMIENILSSTKQNESDSFIDFCKELKKKL